MIMIVNDEEPAQGCLPVGRLPGAFLFWQGRINCLALPRASKVGYLMMGACLALGKVEPEIATSLTLW